MQERKEDKERTFLLQKSMMDMVNMVNNQLRSFAPHPSADTPGNVVFASPAPDHSAASAWGDDSDSDSDKEN